jgi:hypothetical protein
MPSPEWAAMSPEMRRRMAWTYDNDIHALTASMQQRFGDRLAGGTVEAVGDGFRSVHLVVGLTDDENREVLAGLGDRAQLLRLQGVRYSLTDLERIQEELREFLAARPDGDAASATARGKYNAVTVWIRPDAPQLAEAVVERFDDAVRIEWGERHFGWSAPPAG